MAAVGLASLSNLRGDHNLMTTARQRYGMALKQTGRLIQTSVTPDFEVTMRSVVMLAMFEVCALTPEFSSSSSPMVSLIFFHFLLVLSLPSSHLLTALCSW